MFCLNPLESSLWSGSVKHPGLLKHKPSLQNIVLDIKSFPQPENNFYIFVLSFRTFETNTKQQNPVNAQKTKIVFKRSIVPCLWGAHDIFSTFTEIYEWIFCME